MTGMMSRPAATCLVALLFVLALLPVGKHAVTPEEMLSDPALESRARDLSNSFAALLPEPVDR